MDMHTFMLHFSFVSFYRLLENLLSKHSSIYITCVYVSILFKIHPITKHSGRVYLPCCAYLTKIELSSNYSVKLMHRHTVIHSVPNPAYYLD